MRVRRSLAAATLYATILYSPAALTHGAIAVGQPASVAKDGVAIGYTWNYDTPGQAEADALKQCLSFMDAPDSTRALCKVARTFSHQCVAISLDPAAGTEGFGWSVSPTQQVASDAALQQCRDSDGPEHAAACQMSAQECDVKP